MKHEIESGFDDPDQEDLRRVIEWIKGETPDERKRRIEIEKGEIARDIAKDDL